MAINEDHDKDCAKEGFQLPSAKLDRCGEGAGQVQGWSVASSLFEMKP